ncbi:hypothetical protein RSc3042 [Ralstonia pseudosolanacearum GMI1000]|uniref:Uncharacterized protein n=1 Tax=Ralstonia nicotianae (strain ATCC BAA-1114 / GMI1000) TaxID=267608 RepID=Q8XUZ1_RALN1|nr:hypothetical protein RSc3042 [Ralstonia pseudosolanacearum GMI1000]
MRLSSREKTHLLELFVLGVPVYRQRFDTSVSTKSRERFYRLIRACMAQQEQLRDAYSVFELKRWHAASLGRLCPAR